MARDTCLVTQVIVWDPDLIQPMTIIAEATFIRKGGVTKMVRLPVTGLTERYEDASEFIFLVRPTLAIVDMVAEAIRLITLQVEGLPLILYFPTEPPRRRWRRGLRWLSHLTKWSTVSPNSGWGTLWVASYPKFPICLQDLGLEHGSRSPVQFYINEYHLDILPLDSDVLSLDIPTAFKVR